MAGTLTLTMVPTSQYVARGGTGYVAEFTLTTTDSVQLSGFNISLATDPLGGISFTSADTSVTNYIFGTNGVGLLFSTPSGSNTADINDSPDTPPVMTLAAGTYGLGEIFFNVAANAPLGVVNVTLDPSTAFSDGDGNPLPYIPSGDATIGTVVAVPEPSSLLMSAIGIATGLASLAKRRHTSEKA